MMKFECSFDGYPGLAGTQVQMRPFLVDILKSEQYEPRKVCLGFRCWIQFMRRGLFICLLIAIAGGIGVLYYLPQFPEKIAKVDQSVEALPQATTPVSQQSPARDLWPIRLLDVENNGGITFQHQTGTNSDKPFPAANGSGIACLDYDLDGWTDLYFATGTPFPIDSTRSKPTNELYRWVGNWNFENVTELSGLAHNGYSAGLAAGDYDNDGFADVFVNCYGPDVLYHNQGDGTFIKVEAGADDPQWGTSATFLDYNQDGLLDLYVCNYAKWTWETNAFCGDREKNVRIYCVPTSVEPARGSLFLNLGDGQFADRSEDVGLSKRLGRGQGVLAVDLNEDHLVDLYIGNDLNANSMFFGETQGRFEDATTLSGAGYDSTGNMQAGMGVDVGDANGDGKLDLIVTNFDGEYNTLYESVGDKQYLDVSSVMGVARDSMPWVGWGVALRDLDLDGDLDLWVTNGHVDDNLKDLGRNTPYAEPGLVWQNVQGHFECLNEAVGPYFEKHHVGRALVVADFDQDGDWDGIVGHQDERPHLFRNDCVEARFGSDSSPPRHALTIKLVGRTSSRDVIGATVWLKSTRGRRVEPVRGGGSYLSSSETNLIFALQSAEAAIELEILWPSGLRTVVTQLPQAARIMIIEPGEAGLKPRVFSLK